MMRFLPGSTLPAVSSGLAGSGCGLTYAFFAATFFVAFFAVFFVAFFTADQGAANAHDGYVEIVHGHDSYRHGRYLLTQINTCCIFYRNYYINICAKMQKEIFVKKTSIQGKGLRRQVDRRLHFAMPCCD